MSDNLRLTFPHGLITKISVGEFTLLTDYTEERGGNGVAPNPWRLFLSALLSCHGVNLAKYCRQHNLDYSQVSLELVPFVEDVRCDPFPEYHICVTVPEDFPKEHLEPMVQFFTDCPVSNHLTTLKPIVKTFVNATLMSDKRRA